MRGPVLVPTPVDACLVCSLQSLKPGTAALLPRVPPASMVQLGSAGCYCQESRLGTETVSGGGCVRVCLPPPPSSPLRFPN
ncbi:hypothetical protein LX36DRAFT_653529, partial [Colletotrichum falcatum]